MMMMSKLDTTSGNEMQDDLKLNDKATCINY